jgi:peptidoglycan hydrolase CwlO-like protein
MEDHGHLYNEYIDKIAALESEVKEKDEQIAALTATIKRTDDIILTLTDDNEKQAERIAALTAELEVERIKQKDWIAGCEICRKGG